MGLTTAYNIALLGERDVTIVEQGYIASGASCRNAGHFSVHFWAPENAHFAIETNIKLDLPMVADHIVVSGPGCRPNTEEAANRQTE